MTKKTQKDSQIPKTVKNVDFNNFVEKKINQVIDIIQRTYLSLSFCKQFDIFSKNSIGQCTDHLQTIYLSAKTVKESIPILDKDMDNILTDIQHIFDKLSIVFSTYGTYSIIDVYYVVFGTKYNNFDTYDKENKFMADKIELIEKYVMPIGYKNLPWSECSNSDDNIDKITDVTLQIDKYSHMECFQPTTMYSSIHQSVFGLRILIRNTIDNKLLCVSGLTKDIPLQYLLDNNFVITQLESVKQCLLESFCDKEELITRWIDTITLKDILVFSPNDFLKKFITTLKDAEYVKSSRVDNIVKKFFEMDLISRRKMLINLFIYNTDNEVQYIAYMLYDLIGSVENNDGVDNNEQVILYESLPWKLKQFFKETMINTIEFTQGFINSM